MEKKPIKLGKVYSQIPEVDYQETFGPTARMSSVLALMQLGVQNDMLILEMDVKTAYLNAPIDCDFYMEQQNGFEKFGRNSETLVCKLKKSLYGLKQSDRNWNNMLHNHLIDEHFSQSCADPCIYTRHIDDKRYIIMIIWVDDIIIATSNSKLMASVKESLSKRFKMKDLGEISWFLGTQFKYGKDCIEMNQIN